MPCSARFDWFGVSFRGADGLHFEKVGSAVSEGAGHADVAEGALDAVHAEDMSLLRLPASGSAAGGGGLRLGDARGRAVLQVGPGCAACTTVRGVRLWPTAAGASPAPPRRPEPLAGAWAPSDRASTSSAGIN